MSEQKGQKLNHLIAALSDSDVVTSTWLQASGYSRSLLARYVKSGWLRSPSRGAYTKAGAQLRWDGVLYSLQQREGLRLHPGGRFVLSWRGHEHYLRLNAPATITVYGADRVPKWATDLPLAEQIDDCGRGAFPAVPSYHAPSTELYEHGLQRAMDTDASLRADVVMSMPERAVLELCADVKDAAGVYEVDAVLQGMPNLRPDLVSRLLRLCSRVKAKRLFLALADRHAHAWFARVSLESVDLGTGKRMLVRNGQLNRKFEITLPADLDDQLG